MPGTANNEEQKLTLVNRAFKLVKARRIENHNRNYLFRIRGLTAKNNDIIQQALNEKKAYIKSRALINSETSVVSILANIEPGKMDSFVSMLNSHIRRNLRAAKLPYRDCQLYSIKSKENEEDSVKIANSYFTRSLINGLYSVAVVLVLSYVGVPVTLFSQIVGLGVGFLTLGVMWKTGSDFYKEAWTAFVENQSFNMYSLIALGTLSAWAYSMMMIFFPATVLSAGLQYQFAPINLILWIVNIGRGVRCRVEESTRQMVQGQEETYAQYQPQFANRLEIDTLNVEHANEVAHHKQVYYKEIKKNDLILVKKGMRFPIDGVIVSQSQTSVEQSALTGEMRSVNKKKGDSIFGGSLNVDQSVIIRATSNGNRGKLSKILKAVKKAKSSRPSISNYTDRIANVFVPLIIAIAGLSAFGWLVFGPVPQLSWMMSSFMSVLLCACPCAIGLSIIPISIGIGQMFQKKIIVREASAIEALAEVDTVVWDKTGTLTTPKVKDVYISSQRMTKDKIMLIAAKLEKACDKSEHPIAQALIQYGLTPMRENITVTNDVQSDTQGVTGTVLIDRKAHRVTLGNLHYVTDKQKCEISATLKRKGENYLSKKQTPTYIAIDNRCVGVVGLAHDARKDAAQVIENLIKLGIDVYMLTGDKEGPAQAIAAKLGIKSSHVISNRKYDEKRKEDEKADYIKELQNAGRKVAMIGDGVNDLIAMKRANVPISAGAWTNTAKNSHLVLQKLNVDTAIIIAREIMKNIKQNLGWTLFYNTISIAFATGLMYPIYGVVLNPAVATMMMMLSSIFVIINSNRLIFEINDKLDIHEKRVPKPTTLFEKFKRAFSPASFLKTIFMIFDAVDGVKQKSPLTRTLVRQSVFPESPPKPYQLRQKNSTGNVVTNLKPKVLFEPPTPPKIRLS